MEFVEPIRNKKQLEGMKQYLKKSNPRDHLLFILGINSGLRISDLLSLAVKDVKNKERITIREIKTGKRKDFPLSETCKIIIAEYTTIVTDGWLFPSRKGDKAITRIQAYRIINEAAKTVGIRDAVGTHTLRKTFSYWAFKSGHDISVIQKLLNHSSPSTTLSYIGITRDHLDSVYINLNL